MNPADPAVPLAVTATLAARRLDAGYAVGPQLAPEDLAALAARGFRAILCNRPDGEGPGQPAFPALERAAGAAGLAAAYLPLDTSVVSHEQQQAFARLIDELPKPVFAFCRTGRRSASLWAHAMRPHLARAEILAATRAAGFELDDVLPRSH